MKKTGVPSLKEMGGGVFLADADKGKPIPNNAGKKYFKWSMQARLTLLRECQFREVWSFPSKKKTEAWHELCTVLKSISNTHSAVERVD